MSSSPQALVWKERLSAAECHSRDGKWQLAETLYKQALDIAGSLGDHERVATMTQLADFYMRQREFAKAEPLYRQSCEIYDQLFGLKSIVGAMCLRSLGEVLEALGKNSEAQTVKNKASEMWSASN